MQALTAQSFKRSQMLLKLTRYPTLICLSLLSLIMGYNAWSVGSALHYDLNTTGATVISWAEFLIAIGGLVCAVVLGVASTDSNSGVRRDAMPVASAGFALVAWAVLSFQIFDIPESIPVPENEVLLLTDGSFRYPGQSYEPGFLSPAVNNRVAMEYATTLRTELRERTDRTETELVRNNNMRLTVRYRFGPAFEQKLREVADRRDFESVPDALARDAATELQPLFQAAMERGPNRFQAGNVVRTPVPWIASVRVESNDVAYNVADPTKDK